MAIDILNKRSKDLNDDGSPKLPSAEDLKYGQIAINYAKGKETIAIKNDQDEVVAINSGIKGVKVGSNTTNESVTNGIVTVANASNDRDGTITSNMYRQLSTKYLISDIQTNTNDEDVAIQITVFTANGGMGKYLYTTINKATSSLAGVISSSDKIKLDSIINTGDGTKFLADNFTYKSIAATDIPDLSDTYLPLIGGNITGSVSVASMVSADTISATNQLTAVNGLVNTFGVGTMTISEELTVQGNTTLGNVTITGNITQQGDSFITEAETVQVKDNLLVLNNGEAGAGVTAGISGIEVDRGTETNYQFIFDESDDYFKVGEVGNLQTVLTRDTDANLTNNKFFYWDNTTKQAKTRDVAISDISGLQTDGDGSLYLANDGTYKDVSASSEQEIYTIVPSETANTANASVYTLLKNNSNIVVVYKDNSLFFPISWESTTGTTLVGSAVIFKFPTYTVGSIDDDWISYDIDLNSEGVCYCTQRSLQGAFAALKVISFIYPSDNVTATGWNASLYSVVNPAAGYAVVTETEGYDDNYNKHIGKITKTPDNITIVCTEGNKQITYVCTPDGNITKQEADITIDWSNIESKPSTHTHTVSQITDLQNKLNEYVPINGDSFKPNNMCWGGTKTDGTTTCLAFINPEDIALFGHTSLPLTLRSSSNPNVLVGTSTYTLLHTGNFGSITFTGAATGTFNGTNELTINIPSQPSLSGYATQSWVNSQGFLTSVPAQSWSSITGKPSTFTPAAHNQASNTITALTGYSEGSSTTTLTASMSLNAALASLQNQIQTKAASSHTHTASQVSGLATVATSGSYNDLSNKPTIPSLSGYATQTWANGQFYPLNGKGYMTFDTNGRPVMDNNQGYSCKKADGTAIEVLWINPSNTLLVGGTSSSSLGTIQFQTDNLVTKSGKRVAFTSDIPTIPTLSGGASATSGQYVSGVTVSGHTVTVTKASLPTVTLSSLGVTATAAELNKLDGCTATTAELNYVDGVTSNIQTQLNGKAASSHTHSNYATTDSVSSAISEASYNTGHNQVSSLSNVPTTKRLVIAGVNSSQSFSCGTIADGRELHVVVYNVSSSDIIITLPTSMTVGYVNLVGDSLTVKGNSYAEINVISDGSDKYIRAI